MIPLYAAVGLWLNNPLHIVALQGVQILMARGNPDVGRDLVACPHRATRGGVNNWWRMQATLVQSVSNLIQQWRVGLSPSIWPIYSTIYLYSFLLEWSTAVFPNSGPPVPPTAPCCCRPGQTYLIQLIEDLMSSWIRCAYLRMCTVVELGNTVWNDSKCKSSVSRPWIISLDVSPLVEASGHWDEN